MAAETSAGIERVDRNGLLLAELLDLTEALGVGVAFEEPPVPPRFADLARHA